MTPVECNDSKKQLYLNANPIRKVVGIGASENSRDGYSTDVHSGITNIFSPSLKIFRWVGVSTLYASTVDGTQVVRSHKKYSLAFIQVCLVAVVQLFSVAAIILNRVFEISGPLPIFRIPSVSGPSNSKDSADFGLGTLIFQVVFPISGSLQMLAARIHFKELEHFLNNWTVFMLKFQHIFSPFHSFNLQFIKNFRTLVVVGNGVMILVLFYSRFGGRELFLIENKMLNVLITNLFIGYIVLATSLLTIVTMVGLQTIRLAFRETGLAMGKQYYFEAKSITREDVKAWTQLVIDIRAQVSSFQKFASLPELLDLISNFITLLTISFITVTSIGSKDTMLAYGILAVVSSLFKSAMRGILSDKLTKEEEMLAFSVLEMKPDLQDCGVRLEMKILCDTIFSNPVQFTLGNIITVNKRLVLSLISQLAAYLVVLLQFKGRG